MDFDDINIYDYKRFDNKIKDQIPGRPSGSINKSIELPIKFLKKLHSLRGEDEIVKKSMPRVQAIAKLIVDKKWRSDNPIQLEVHADGEICVADGAHRIKACLVAEIKTYPCKIKFYGGSEDDFNLKKEIKNASELEKLIKTAKNLIEINESPEPIIKNLPKFATSYPFGKTKICRGKGCGSASTGGGLFCDKCRTSPTLETKPAIKPGEPMYVDKRTQQNIWNENRNEINRRKREANSETGVGGATDVDGSPVDQEYANMYDANVEEAGQRDADKGNNPSFNEYNRQADSSIKDDEDLNHEKHANDLKFAPKNSIDFEHKTRQSVPHVGDSPMPMPLRHKEHKSDNVVEQVPKNQPKGLIMNEHESPMNQKHENYTSEGTPRLSPLMREEMKDITNPKKNKIISKNSINDLAYKFMQIYASSNKPCPGCGLPTDRCKCNDNTNISPGYTQDGKQRTNNPVKTQKALPDELNPLKSHALIDDEKLDTLIKAGYIPNKFIKEASHVEEIEIPFKDLGLNNGVNYHMSGRQQEVERLAHKYLQMHVYTEKHRKFTIVSMEQDMSAIYVKCIIFDSAINHEASLGNVSNIKTSNTDNNVGKIQKVAWRKRLTQVLGDDDSTGLVECPIEGNFLTRSCGTCPLAGNPETYIKDGYVECHFDDSTSWLAGKSVKEHRRLDAS